MGCVSSKKATRTLSPDHVITDARRRSSSSARSTRSARFSSRSGSLHVQRASSGKLKDDQPDNKAAAAAAGQDAPPPAEDKSALNGHDCDDNDENSKVLKRGASQKKKAAAVFSINFGRLSESEQVAAGWPAWLTAVAAEAIDGWVPLSPDAYERLDKIGQGTYSHVYRAREVGTGKMVAVKKVRFDNFQPESVRFMAREILILRRLDHPNIMRLQGIITSRLSCSIYLVFDYMEHDLAGLLSCPDIQFTDSQIKCYMKQLLSGLEHCHTRGVMHRDIKSSNILVNNQGILKIADFGLANFVRPKNKQPLTSRVVTLWYRPPELLLGSTNYTETVDLWSVGCVFAELFLGRPFLKGRTEVEQLHKIFKLCGSPPEDYWKKSRLPLATMFKPQQPYESTLRERCKEFPKSAVSLIEKFLAVEPHKRGTASSALKSEYFSTKPYACEPSSLPKYPPNKEMDAKTREDERRKKAGAAAARQEAGSRKPRRNRKTLPESSDFCKVVPNDEVDANVRRAHIGNPILHRRRGSIETRASLKQPYDTKSDISQTTQDSQGSSTRSVPAEVAGSSSFAWAKRQKHHQDVFTRLHSQPTTSRIQKYNAASPSSSISSSSSQNATEADGQDNDKLSSGRTRRMEVAMRREQGQLHRLDSFDSSDIYEPQELPEDYSNKKSGRVAFSGPLIYQSQEMGSKQFEVPRQAPVRRSRFYKD